MVFASIFFLYAFLPCVLLTYYAAPRVLRNTILLLFSLVFYAWGEPKLVVVMLGSIAGNWAAGLTVHRARTPRGKKLVLSAAVVANLGVLATFKYAGFLATNLNSLLALLDVAPVPVPEIRLPLGISFFTFQAMSYVIGVYWRQTHPQSNPFALALYISLFPQLIAGPIVRYVAIADQLVARTETLERFAYGVIRFTIGLAKKVLIANAVAPVADGIFALPPDQLSLALTWTGALAYSLQIYFDFAGYSDMAVGLGHMFGFTFVENFNYPYISRSITEFWRRWHISLSTWFRDYLYIPLGGNRRSPARTYFNLMVVFLPCGLWHGASWTFVAWGMFHGVFLVLERLGVGNLLLRAPRGLAHAYAVVVVLFGWVLFRAPDFPSAWAYLGGMLGGAPLSNPIFPVRYFVSNNAAVMLVVGCIAATPFGAHAARLVRERNPLLEPASTLVVVGLLFVSSVAALAAGAYNPFIYYRF
jgi:alginate O-acetyltransferase complex protein AlgI